MKGYLKHRSVAVAQTCPVRGDVHANTDEHLRLAHLAVAEGAGIVLFPELSLTGYELGLAHELAFTEPDARLDPLRSAARAMSVVLIAGAPFRVDTRLHIGAVIFRPDGTTALYTKHRLGAFPESAARDGTVPPAEATVFSPGELNPAVAFGDATAAIAVCADIGDPSHVQRAAAGGAAAYLASMFVIPSDFDGEAAALEMYAAQHSVVVAMANFGCASGGLAAAGRSSIWSDTGQLLARLEPAGSGVAVASEEDGGWVAKTIMRNP